MNNVIPISSYDDLKNEKERLKALLKTQKAIINVDIAEIREEFQPVVIASEMFGKLLNREDGKDAVVTAGTNLTIDLLVSKVFSKSNFLIKLILPAILKNLSSHYIPKASPLQKRTSPAPNGVVVRKEPEAVLAGDF